MEPIAYGFFRLVAGTVVVGLLVGAIGGAVVCGMRRNLFLGFLLTVCGFLLILFADRFQGLRSLCGEFIWGAAPMTLTYLACAIAARALEARTRLRPVWIALAAFGFSILIGYLYSLVFGSMFMDGLREPLLIAVGADVCLFLLILLMPRRQAATR